MEGDCPDQFENQSLRARTSDLDDIDLLVRNYRPGVFRYVLVRVGDRDFAETVTQDCFMRAYRSRGDFRGECSVRTWLITIATNVIRDYTRTKRFRFWKEANAMGVQLSEINDRVAAHGLSPETGLLIGEQIAKIRSAIKALPERQKQILLMRFDKEMKLGEIASNTGMTISTIKTHLYRGIRSLRAQDQNDHKSAARE